MPSYAQRTPGPGQPPNQYSQQGNTAYPGGPASGPTAGPQYPSNHNQQMGYPGHPSAPQGAWPQSQQMPSDMPRLPSAGT